MYKNNQLKRICSFNVSNWHLITMCVPYINRKIEEGTCVKNISEESMKNMVEMFLEKLVLNDKTKEKIINSNWKSSKTLTKYSNLDKFMTSLVKENEKVSIIVNGRKEYIEIINKNIDKWVAKNSDKIEGKEISVVNCYEITQFNKNIREILGSHDKILNTSGEKNIEEVFEGYEEEKNPKSNVV